jgi:hypothetical protein
MTREELAGKTKPKLLEIAKSLGIKGISKLTREDLIEHILLLDPPFSANPEQESAIAKHLTRTLNHADNLNPPPLPEHLLGVNVAEEREQQIPQDYNVTKIGLLVRDPYWLYCYWSTSGETRELVSGQQPWEQVALILRVYDVTGIEFNGTNSNFYFDVSVGHQANNWYIHVGGPNRCFCVDLGFIMANGAFYTIARSNPVTTPRDNVSDVIDEEWMIIEDDFRKLYQLAGAGATNSSAELVESLISRLEREMGSGIVSSLSSPVQYQPKERKFWMVLNTELIVYGATEPDARVTVQGEPIEIRPDGTFTLRFALPEGTQCIPVSARSADGIDTITITPIVSKQTQ